MKIIKGELIQIFVKGKNFQSKYYMNFLKTINPTINQLNVDFV